MGLFGFLRRGEERAMPDPGTPEFEAAVSGTALPGSVEMGQGGWASTRAGGEAAEGALRRLGLDLDGVEVERAGSQRVDLRGAGARQEVEALLREHGIDPDKEGQTIDASTVPGLQEAILGALGSAGLKLPDAGGFGGGVSPPDQDPLAVVEHLAAKRDAGEISAAEFEAQKRRLLGG